MSAADAKHSNTKKMIEDNIIMSAERENLSDTNSHQLNYHKQLSITKARETQKKEQACTKIINDETTTVDEEDEALDFNLYIFGI